MLKPEENAGAAGLVRRAFLPQPQNLSVLIRGKSNLIFRVAVRRLKPPLRDCAPGAIHSFNPKSTIINRKSSIGFPPFFRPCRGWGSERCRVPGGWRHRLISVVPPARHLRSFIIQNSSLRTPPSLGCHREPGNRHSPNSRIHQSPYLTTRSRRTHQVWWGPVTRKRTALTGLPSRSALALP